MLKSLFVMACLFLPVHVFGEVPVWKATLVSGPVSIGYAGVRAAVGMGDAKKLLIAPLGAGQPWVVVDAAGKRLALASTPPNVLATLSEHYVAWSEHTPLGAKIHRLRLSDLHQEVVQSDATGLVYLAVAGEVIYTLHRDQFGWRLGRVKAGRFERIASLDEGSTLLQFGECSEDQVVLVDVKNARFNVLHGPGFRNAGFVAMQSEVAEEAKRYRGSLQNYGAANITHFAVFAHKRTEKGHGFVLAKAEKGVGQYFVEFDDNGKEVRKTLLGIPEGKHKNSGPFHFRLLNGDGGTLEVTKPTGETVILRSEGGGAVN